MFRNSRLVNRNKIPNPNPNPNQNQNQNHILRYHPNYIPNAVLHYQSKKKLNNHRVKTYSVLF